ncbi:MAG: hypothetical protein N2509_00685 [Treponemataceae bacterium]|nr:hypothetical protein [Treponemataceae bacterium]
MHHKEHIADYSVWRTVFKALKHKKIRQAGLRCLGRALRDFFGLQYWAVLHRGKIPVCQVDHPLDQEIPFVPEKVTIYLDFVFFWIRAVGFLFDRYGPSTEEEIAAFVDSMGRLYSFAAEVYRHNLSTTQRPRYLKHPRFILIHFLDPHLMCIPSLHVMVVVHAWKQFKAFLNRHEEQELFTSHVQELHQGARAISASILFVKQHSINCVPAALYALTCYDESLWSAEEAHDFIEELLTEEPGISPEAKEKIQHFMKKQYDSFLQEKSNSQATPFWGKPLLDFLQSQPRVR